MMKTKQDNDITNCTGMVNPRNETELSCPIGPGAIYDENHIGE